MNSAQSIAGQQSKYWRLRRSEFVEGMSDADVKDLSRLCEIRVVERGRAVYDVGQVSDKIYIVESGSVKLTRTAEEGRAVNTGVLGPMEIFGELSLVGEHARLDRAEALEQNKFLR